MLHVSRHFLIIRYIRGLTAAVQCRICSDYQADVRANTMSSPLESPPSERLRTNYSRRGSPVVALVGFAVAAVVPARSGLPGSFCPLAEATVTGWPGCAPCRPGDLSRHGRASRHDVLGRVLRTSRGGGEGRRGPASPGWLRPSTCRGPAGRGRRPARIIDPASYAAVVFGLEALVAAAEGKWLALSPDRISSGPEAVGPTPSRPGELDGRINAEKEAEVNLRAK